jgi:hypothetical protein
MPHRPYRLSAAVLAASLSQLGLAATPTKLEEIRVTGEPMQRSSLETISSISIVSEQEIEARNIRDLYDLLLRTPNVNAAKEDKFSVRGISNEGIGPGGAGRPTVSVFIDGARAPGRGVGNTWAHWREQFSSIPAIPATSLTDKSKPVSPTTADKKRALRLAVHWVAAFPRATPARQTTVMAKSPIPRSTMTSGRPARGICNAPNWAGRATAIRPC